jgi:hypothetical protein
MVIDKCAQLLTMLLLSIPLFEDQPGGFSV